MPTLEELMDALDSLVWYNCAYERIAEVKRYIEQFNESGVIKFPAAILSYSEGDDYTPHAIWFLMVCMFGDYGTSPRSGWIEPENKDKAIAFLNAVLSTYRDSGEYVEE